MGIERGDDNPTLDRLTWIGEMYGVEFKLSAAPIKKPKRKKTQ